MLAWLTLGSEVIKFATGSPQARPHIRRIASIKEEQEQVVAVAEKRPISNNATSGIYYFKSSRHFLEAAEKMILKNATVQGEFYVCPVYNELILMGHRIGLFKIRY